MEFIERTDNMAQSLRIDGFLEDYPALVDPDCHDPSPDALIDMVLIATEQATSGESFSILVDGDPRSRIQRVQLQY